MGKIFVKYSPQITLIAMFLILNFGNLSAQTPYGLPHPKPDDSLKIKTLADFIIYILSPFLITLFYFIHKQLDNNHRHQ